MLQACFYKYCKILKGSLCGFCVVDTMQELNYRNTNREFQDEVS